MTEKQILLTALIVLGITASLVSWGLIFLMAIVGFILYSGKGL